MKTIHPGFSLFAIDSLATSRLKSCTSCRVRKRKCSRQFPVCSNCLKNSLLCSYPNNPRDHKLHEQAEILLELSSHRPHVASDSHSGPEMLPHNPSEEYRGIDQEPTPSSSDGGSGPSRKPSLLSISSTSSGVHKLTYSQSCGSKAPSPPLDSGKTASISNRRQGLDALPEQTNITVTKPASKSMWPRVDQDELLRFKDDPNVRVGPMYTKIFNSSLTSTGKSLDADLNLLESLLPPRKVADTLLARYVNSVHPIMPLIDVKQLHPQYEMFWNNRASASLPFYIIIFAVLYASSVSDFEESTFSDISSSAKQDRVDLMRHLVGATEIALAVSDFPAKVTLVGLKASVILHSVIRNDCRTDDCGSVAALVRLAQLIELNRDPQSYHKIEDPLQIQERRLLWWHIFYLDCTTSLSSRVPPIIVEDEYDTCPPTEYTEKNGKYQLDQPIAFANGKFRWAETCNKISRCAFLLTALTQSTVDRMVLEIEDLGLHCTSSILRILDPSNVMPHQEHFVGFSSSMLSTFKDRCFCLLNMVLSTRQNLVQTSSTADVLVNSLGDSLVKNMLHLLQEFCKHGSMPQNAIFLWDIRKYQPIQVLLFLLRNLVSDVMKLPFDLHALKLDERASTIERSMETLGYLSDHSTKLCYERWELLRDLKAVAWEQIFNSVGTLSLNSSSPKLSPSEIKVPENFGEDWDTIVQKLTSIENAIDENIFTVFWDDVSGHYVM